MRSFLASVLTASVCLLQTSHAAINFYKNEHLPVDLLMYRKNGMYSELDAPSIGPHPFSHVKVDFTMSRVNDEFPGRTPNIEISFFEASDYDKIGFVEKNGDKRFCCTNDMVSQGICDEASHLIVRDDPKNPKIQVDTVTFENHDGKTVDEKVLRIFEVKKKGLYYLMFTSCDPITGEVVVNGHSTWRNPYGYLPGELYGFIPFYGRLAVCYMIASLAWAILCSRYWKELITLQNCISIVLFLGMLEVALRYFDFHSYNETGVRNHGLVFAAVIFSTVKKVVSRMLVLVVCMGFGVVRPTLGASQNKVFGLGFTYFLFAALQNVFENLSHSNAIMFSQYLMLLPVAALDVVFYLWIFKSLQATIQQLGSRNQDVKLQLYLRFQRMLTVSVALSLSWALYNMYMILSREIFVQWETRWILEGFWDVIYFAIQLMVMFLWRPNQNSQRYAYHQIGTWEHDEDEDYDDDLEDPVAKGIDMPVVSSPNVADEIFDTILDQEEVVAKRD